MLGRLVAILTFSRRTGSLTGPAKVIDGDTIVVAEQLVRLHGIDAPELDQSFWWQGQKLMGGMMALAAIETLTAGVKVRCEVVERDRHGRIVAKVFAPKGSGHVFLGEPGKRVGAVGVRDQDPCPAKRTAQDRRCNPRPCCT